MSERVVIGIDTGGDHMAISPVSSVSLRLGIDPQSSEGFARAITALAERLEQVALLDALPDGFAEAIEAFVNLGGEALFEFGKGGLYSRRDRAACGAGHAFIGFDPSDRFREFVAAVASQLDAEIIDVHGWPVLALVGENSNVTGAGGGGESVTPSQGGDA